MTEQKILDLLDKENWEIKTLGEIATETYSGNGVIKSQLGTGNYPAIRYCEIHNSNIYIKQNKSFINPELIKNKKYCEFGDLIITHVSEDLKNAGKCVAYLGEKCILGNGILLIKHNQNPLFLSYMLSTKIIRKQIERLVNKGVVMHFKSSSINKIKIPLPPLEEQEKIVSILEEFTKSLTNMKEKIDLLKQSREQQYKYFSNKAFS